MQKLKKSYENLLSVAFFFLQHSQGYFLTFLHLPPQVHNAHCLFIKYPHIACSHSGPSTAILSTFVPFRVDLLSGSKKKALFKQVMHRKLKEWTKNKF